ncbi:MAG TPA: amino acid adenylation domain-containing protein, partial [Pyrinomonadaceae bacterium]|nr:amino acid adenylation domain-containing protein [Pyrinomonadaceae bacterium]
MSYRELDGRANRLAHHLRGMGVGPESLVGVLLERGAEMVVTLLAVLKAGAAYLPLDPRYPADRLSFMLEDGGAEVVVTQSALATLVGDGGARLVLLDDERDEITRQSAGAVESGAVAENLAYVIYTSGSTGRPKGVAIAHRSAAVLCAWAHSVYTADQIRAVLASTSICFDLSVFELFVPLSCGGKVVLADNALQLPLLSAADEVTLVNTVPSAMTELLRMGGLPASVRTVNLAGEPLKNSLVQQIYERTRTTQVWNLYGPSEDTTYSTYALIKRGAGREPSIGRPVANTRAHLLDANLRQVPVGAVGEIYLGGDGLARGYLGRPELTAERFIADPFSTEPGGRMYRTGDLGRYLSGGEVEFLGRADHQVKVRGFRIELGEVEAELGRHAGVRECVVVAREEASGDTRLVAYLVAEAGGALDEAELRRALKERLPDYMIPSVFVVLEEMPLTPNGKINRQALPAPDPSRSETADGFVAPQTPVEERLAEIWGEVLGLVRVGSNDNFFDLGGHSLLATRVISRVREAFGIDVPLHALFQAATIGQLAARVEEERNAGRIAPAGPLAPVARDGELPLSFAQQRLWFLEQLEPGSTTYHIPAAVRLTGALDVGALGRTLSEIVRRHEALRTVFKSVDGRPLQQIMPATPVEIPLVDLSALGDAGREAEASRLSHEEAARPFDLARGPLMRARLLRLDGDEHLLMVTMHHIVSDGWSLGVLLREMTELYRAFLSGEPSPLAELPVQYADFAAWQRETLRGEVLEGQLDYWKKQLGGRVPVLELPGMKQRPAVQSFRGAVERLELSPELSAQLEALSRREGATLFMTLLTAFQTLLHRYTGQSDIAVGSPTAGRTRLETESLIGFFVNTLVLRSSFDGDPTFAEALRRVRETTLEGHAHQDVPFEKLVETLQPERSLSHSPLFQVMFVWQNTSSLAAEWPGVSVKPAPVESTTAKFDLTLFMEESAEGLSATFEYNRDLFDEESIGRMAEHFRTLLTSVVGDPAERVAELQLLTEREREQLALWNLTETVEATACLHELFEAQVERTPEAEALVFGGERVSYRELDGRANRLAHHLRGMG